MLLFRKFGELCNEETPMVKRACAAKLGVILYNFFFIPFLINLYLENYI